jgi:ribonuclease HII
MESAGPGVKCLGLHFCASRGNVPAVAGSVPATAVGDLFEFERALLARGVRCLAGVDEAGRGPLAGPVVAGAAVLPGEWIEHGLPPDLHGLNDSKQLTAAQRERFFIALTTHPSVRFALARVDAPAVDLVNILRATHQAIREALSALRPEPGHALIDGLPVTPLAVPQTAVVKGDARSYSIAAASVLAKVTRDRLMIEYDRQYPEYGFAEHKGYGTARHLAALARHGPCPIHRRSFAPLKPAQIELL